MDRSFSISARIYPGLMAYLCLVKLALTYFHGVLRSPSQAAVFRWPLLGIWTVLGLTGIWFAERTGFPQAWGEPGSNQKRVKVALLVGAGFGVLLILTDLATNWTQVIAARMYIASIHIPFPASALIYPGGAVIVEVIYRLFLLPLLLWLISRMLLQGRGQEQTFWVLAALTSLMEPMTQDLGPILAGPARFTMAIVFVEDYAVNFAQAWLFRRYGFLSAILSRVGLYLVWHVLWGLTGR